MLFALLHVSALAALGATHQLSGSDAVDTCSYWISVFQNKTDAARGPFECARTAIMDAHTRLERERTCAHMETLEQLYFGVMTEAFELELHLALTVANRMKRMEALNAAAEADLERYTAAREAQERATARYTAAKDGYERAEADFNRQILKVAKWVMDGALDGDVRRAFLLLILAFACAHRVAIWCIWYGCNIYTWAFQRHRKSGLQSNVQ